MKKYLSVILLLSGFCSCQKQLEEKPQSIAAEVFYNTDNEIQAGLNAIYTPIRSTGSMGALYQIQLEIYADYNYGRGSHAPLNTYQGLDNTNITRVADMWRAFYQAIRNANIVIQRAPLANSVSETNINKYVAEAKFMRAVWYFHLVRDWAGVPLHTEANMDSLDVKRSTEAEVYALIASDLQYAEQYLPETPRLIGTPSKWGAKTVLADVYMYMNKYADAKAKAAEVIASGKYALVPVAVSDDFDKVFGPEVINTPEEIFYLKFSRAPAGQDFNYPRYTHYPNSGYYPPGGFYTMYGDSETNPFCRDWDRKDLRYAFNWYSQTFGLGPTTILSKKFSDRTTTTGAGNDYPMYRYADLLLLYAEAESRVNNGPNADALEKLNIVHRRAYGKNPTVADASVDFKLADYANADAFLKLVVKERGYETASEGKRWHDLKRLGIAKQTILEVKGITVADKHMLWPIPTTEYNYNKAIDPSKDQNPGY